MHHFKNKSQIFYLLKLNLIQESFTSVRSRIHCNHYILAEDLPKKNGICFSEKSAFFLLLFKSCLQKDLNGIMSEDLAQNAAKFKKSTKHHDPLCTVQGNGKQQI